MKDVDRNAISAEDDERLVTSLLTIALSGTTVRPSNSACGLVEAGRSLGLAGGVTCGAGDGSGCLSL